MQALVSAAIATWPLKPLHLALAANRENAVFRVDAEEGVFALRLHRKDYRSDAQLRSEMQFMAALQAQGIAVPKPVLSRNANVIEHIDGTQASVLTWLDGRPLGKSSVPLDIPERLTTFGRFGQLIAKIHTTADQWKPPHGFTRQAWDVDGLLGEAPQWGRFWDNPHLDKQQQKTLREVRDRLRRTLSARHFDMGLIHADLVSENILIDGLNLQVIDFDDSGFGFRLQDLATALVKHEAEPDFAELKQALIAGYQSARLCDASSINLFLLIRHLSYVGWIVPRMSGNDGLKRCDNFIASAIQKAESYLSL
jgi:Ser/Thr protein kinase RdoA (MazF antagonist)